MLNNWTLYDDDNIIINSIAAELGINRLTAAVLNHRGIKDADSARKFLDPERAQPFYDPFSMKGMSEAVERIARAVENRERIVVYGDYDVDGMTASSIMVRALRRHGAAVNAYIPSRQTEGYGLNVDALRKLTYECELVITVDCGISNDAEIAAVKDSLDVIVTDHHLPSGAVTNAIAVLDPHQPDCAYPEKNLCGAGVAFKLCQALDLRINGSDYRDYVDNIELAALGTVADLVPLTGENRKIVRLGLTRMSKTATVGLKELITVAGLDGKKLNAGHCGFSLGPRLNAVGRLESALIGLELLTTDNPVKARQIALTLDRENNRRKDIETKMLAEADGEFQRRREESGGGLSSIVIAREGWHRGVIGLTASKLLERYYLPTIVIALDDELAVGSCRSIAALHMKEALDQFADRFLHYGGHAAAAGFTLKREDAENFARDFDEYVRRKLRDEDFMPTQKLDALIHPAEMTEELAEEFERLAPFGIGNPHPKFGWRGVRGVEVRLMGSSFQHLSFETFLPPAGPIKAPPFKSDGATNIFIPPAHSISAETELSAVDVPPPSRGIDEIDEDAAAFADFDARPDFVDEDLDARPDFAEEDFDAPIDFFDDDDVPLDSPAVMPVKKIRAVAWNFGALADLVEHEPVDITFEPSINEFNDIRSVQCMISTLEPSGDAEQFPDRPALARIYKFLRAQSREAAFRSFNLCKLAADFRRSNVAFDDQRLNSIYTFAAAVKVFSEIGLIHFDADGKNFFMPVPNKAFDLNRSRLFKLNSEGDAHER